MSSKCFDAYDYLQEQFRLYSIVIKFIYDQAMPRINLLTTALICIQLISVMVISFVIISRMKTYFRSGKKNRFQVELARSTSELKALEMKTISIDNDYSKNINKQHLEQKISKTSVDSGRSDVSEILKSIEELDRKVAEDLRSIRLIGNVDDSAPGSLDSELKKFKLYPQLYIE